MNPGMRRRRNGWKPEDEALLRRLLLSGYNTKEVGAALDRTPGAIDIKARELGLSQRTLEGRRQWYEPQDPPEDVVVRNKPRPASDIAWSDPDRIEPRYTAEELWRAWSEALQRVEWRNGR